MIKQTEQRNNAGSQYGRRQYEYAHYNMQRTRQTGIHCTLITHFPTCYFYFYV